MTARLLLIEDDASIARFVELALEELPGHAPALPRIEFNVVRTLAGARQALQPGGWHLVISDLMLPDGSAETLLTEGFAEADGAPRWVVFSAGLQENRRAALAARGVARTLRKPVGLIELLDTVAELLGQTPSLPPPPAADDPVQRHFGGDRALFESFRAGCISRFSDDLAQGDAAYSGGDAATLRRVAHGLKAVLELIGHPDLAARARAIEDAGAQGHVDPGWPALAQGLSQLGAQRRR
ncbi:Hpt domain-containing protein [Roseateles sp. BYS96W]|uniref:Hpt domain-containing protein n=1 Tax=Pelomonas nitida TaxID=3299027 RepID=A0ABW7G3J0_9BURK